MRILLLTLLASVLYAQDTTRTSAFQRVEQILSSQKSVNWVQTPTDTAKAADMAHATASLTEVRADPGSCTLSFKDNRDFPDQKYESVQTWKLNLTDIDVIRVESLEGYVDRVRAEGGHPRWGTKTSPTVFVLEMSAAANRKFNVHRWSKNSNNEVIERDLTQPLVFVVFAAEDKAREAAGALQTAKDLCKRAE